MLNYRYFVGALIATSFISWGALLFYRFNHFTIFALFPAVVFLVIAAAVVDINRTRD